MSATRGKGNHHHYRRCPTCGQARRPRSFAQGSEECEECRDMGAAVPARARWALPEDELRGRRLTRYNDIVEASTWTPTHRMCCECYRVLPVDRFRRYGYVCADCRTTAASAAEEGEP